MPVFWLCFSDYVKPTKQTITCSNSTTDTLEKGVKYVQN